RGPRQDVWLSNLEREQGNLRAALEWTERQDNASLGLRMATALVPFWETHGHLIEGLRWLREALTTTHAPTLLRARALAGAGRLAFLYDHTLLSRYAEAEALLTESLVIARELDDNHAIAAALADLGMIHRLQCDFARSADCLEDALVRFRELHDDPGIALVLLNLGSTVEEMHDIVRAHDILSESLERYRALGDLRSIAIAQVLLGHVFLSLGQFQEAVRSIVEATTAHARLGDRWFVTFDLMALAEVLLRQERAHDATRLLGAAEAMREKLGSPVGGVTFKDLVARIATLRSETWFQAAWDEGYALNFADVMQAVRAALQESPPGRRATLSVDPQASVLTRRQRQVAVLLAQGYTDQQIADELFVSVGTVGVHVHAILQKLGLRSRTQVAAYLVAAEAHTTT
ncbi:MAG TPA: tetratricopeptide repeat protein, partial [Nitrolancea sp.]|nr:tetratricopeptide repeat protein [Nitrolancea sp.]